MSRSKRYNKKRKNKTKQTKNNNKKTDPIFDTDKGGRVLTNMVTLIVGISRLQRELHGNQLIKKSCKNVSRSLSIQLNCELHEKMTFKC